ncbi:PepSY domain-containing protein, partial [Methylogaea oryzae]|uniref:PepSY domain-containing protein n=1 Tax=Methylogaea oryzae TaxID=1295382 RepID=UPI0012E23FEE
MAPGTVENLGLLWQQGHYRFRFDIRSSDGQARKVFCDGATGRILPMETNPMSNTTVPPLDLAPDGRPGIKHGAPDQRPDPDDLLAKVERDEAKARRGR